MAQPAGSSRLLRAINETAALGHLLERGPLTRGDLRELTGLAKPTTSEVLRRLREAGLATIVGRTSGGPGPNAEVYAVNPDAAYVAAVSVRALDRSLAAAVGDLAGTIRARKDTAGHTQPRDPVNAVVEAVQSACRQARVSMRRIDHVHLGVPGAYDHGTDTIHYTDVPGWSRPGLVGEIRARLRTEVAVDNDANLAAVAERGRGVCTDAGSFALLWLGEEGIGLAIDLGSTLLRGARGGAGEIGYLPVGLAAKGNRGSAVVQDFHGLVSGDAVRELAGRHAITTRTGREAAAIAAGAPRVHSTFLHALARRIAAGLAAVIAVLDPPLVVLAGEVGQAGGAPLATAVTSALGQLSLARTTVATTGVSDDAVLLGALDAALGSVRATLLGRG